MGDQCCKLQSNSTVTTQSNCDWVGMTQLYP